LLSPVHRRHPFVFIDAPSVSDPELEVLRACGTIHMTPERAVWLQRALTAPLDTERLLRLAKRHRLTPLLHHHLQAAGCDAVPEVLAEALQVAYAANARRNLFLAAELVRIVRWLEAEAIPVLALKGPVLAVTAFGDLALRQFYDLDLLVPPEHVLHARRLLLANGYVADADEAEVEATLRKPEKSQVVLRHDATGQAVELHWRLVPERLSYGFQAKALRERGQDVPLAGTTVRTLAPEDLLVYLCAHGTKHVWRRLHWLVSVAAVLHATPDLDWGRCWAVAGEVRSRRPLRLALALVRDVLGEPLPPVAARWVEDDRRVRWLVAWVHRRLYAGQHREDGVAYNAFLLLTRERLRDGLRHGMGRLRTHLRPGPRDRTLITLPRALYPLYYVLRPLRLAGKAGIDLVRRLSGRF
jgi:hypothetical protein